MITVPLFSSNAAAALDVARAGASPPPAVQGEQH